ncbi:MAG: hypothetical protein ACHREM_09550 [Polyangiales bacterium]
MRLWKLGRSSMVRYLFRELADLAILFSIAGAALLALSYLLHG